MEFAPLKHDLTMSEANLFKANASNAIADRCKTYIWMRCIEEDSKWIGQGDKSKLS